MKADKSFDHGEHGEHGEKPKRAYSSCPVRRGILSHLFLHPPVFPVVKKQA